MYRIVVATVEDEELETKLKLGGAELDVARRRELEAILKEFVNVLDDKPDTGEVHPICSLPYRLWPAWREQIRDELDSLLAAGRLLNRVQGPGHHPLSRRMGPLGYVCVDFRRLKGGVPLRPRKKISGC